MKKTGIKIYLNDERLRYQAYEMTAAFFGADEFEIFVEEQLGAWSLELGEEQVIIDIQANDLQAARKEIKLLVNDAFQVDKAGKISTARVLGLRRLDIHDSDWKKAMEAITESIQVTGTKQYLRVYERDAKGEYQMIPLDVAAL